MLRLFLLLQQPKLLLYQAKLVLHQAKLLLYQTMLLLYNAKLLWQQVKLLLLSWVARREGEEILTAHNIVYSEKFTKNI